MSPAVSCALASEKPPPGNGRNVGGILEHGERVPIPLQGGRNVAGPRIEIGGGEAGRPIAARIARLVGSCERIHEMRARLLQVAALQRSPA